MGKKVKIKIHEAVDERNISIRELSRLSDVRPEALNELANQQRRNINFGHIERTADALKIEDIREIITIEDTDEEKENTRINTLLKISTLPYDPMKNPLHNA